MERFIATNHKKIITGIALLAVVLGIGAGSYIVHRYAVKGAPSFKREYDLVLKTYDGGDVKLASFKNKVLIVSAWASWCPYCQAEIENLAAIEAKHSGDVHVVAVNRAEPLADAKSYSDRVTTSGAIQFLLDPTDSFYKEMGGYAMPETLFIDPYGHVLFHQRGPMSTELMDQKVQELLK